MAAFELEQIIGPTTRTDGYTDGPMRISRLNESVVMDGQGRYYEMVRVGCVFTLTLIATTTGVAAGNIVGAAAAAATQFALLNPLSSGYNLVLLKLGIGIISGTPGAGPMFHGYLPNIASITAASAGGTIRSNKLGATGNSIATPWSLAAGSALTGGQAPVTHRMADFTSTATAQASVGELKAIEYIDGDLVIPPGFGWLPLWGAAGSSLLNGYSITWAEVPV